MKCLRVVNTAIHSKCNLSEGIEVIHGQSSCYVPINRIKEWSWESYWIVQGVFAWLVFPFLARCWQYLPTIRCSRFMQTILRIRFGLCSSELYGEWGLTFGLSMRYLGVALGQSIALGTCAGLGTILTPVFTGKAGDLTTSVIVGVVVTLVGIGIIGLAGSMKSASLSEEEKKKAVKDFNFTKGIIVALLAGFMSACFSIGLGFGEKLCFAESADIFKTLPATLMVTQGFLRMPSIVLHIRGKNLGRLWQEIPI